MQRTGMIDHQNVYKSAKRQGADGWARTGVLSADDPHFVEFMNKNYRSQDLHKIPSAMAWDHSRHGILGEVFDLEEMEQRMKRMNVNF